MELQICRSECELKSQINHCNNMLKGAGYKCSRYKGHEGPHHASSDGRCVMVWTKNFWKQRGSSHVSFVGDGDTINNTPSSPRRGARIATATEVRQRAMWNEVSSSAVDAALRNQRAQGSNDLPI